MGSPVSLIISNLYRGRFEHIASSTYRGIAPSNWFRYVDDAWVVIKQNELDCFFDYINQVDPHIKFTQEGLKENKLAFFLECLVSVEEDCTLTVSVYRKATHTDQYLQFVSNHPFQKLERTLLSRRAQTKSPNAHI